MAKEKRKANRFRVQKIGGEWTQGSREIFKEQFDLLEDGIYDHKIDSVNGYEKPTRYKYYFDGFLPCILEKAGLRYDVIDEHGEIRPPKTVDELHECLKIEFNPVTIINKITKQASRTASSTTNLSDRDFIQNYLPAIEEIFFAAPYYCEIEDYESWRARKKAKWDRIKPSDSERAA